MDWVLKTGYSNGGPHAHTFATCDNETLCLCGYMTVLCLCVHTCIYNVNPMPVHVCAYMNTCKLGICVCVCGYVSMWDCVLVYGCDCELCTHILGCMLGRLGRLASSSLSVPTSLPWWLWKGLINGNATKFPKLRLTSMRGKESSFQWHHHLPKNTLLHGQRETKFWGLFSQENCLLQNALYCPG